MTTASADRLSDDTLVAERIVRGAIEAFRTHAFHLVSASVVGETSGLDCATVTRLFPTWEALLLVTYDRWTELRAQGRRGEQPSCTIDHVRMTLLEDIHDPGLVRLMAGLINYAAAGDNVFSDLFRRRFAEYHAIVAYGLGQDFASGREVSVVDPSDAATQLLALYEGLQIHLLVRPQVDMVDEYDHAVETLRHGWRRGSGGSWDLGV